VKLKAVRAAQITPHKNQIAALALAMAHNQTVRLLKVIFSQAPKSISPCSNPSEPKKKEIML
jgi:hypothetical protein